MIALGTHRGCLTTESEMEALMEDLDLDEMEMEIRKELGFPVKNPCPTCGHDMGRKGYCTGERIKAGLKHFDRKRAEYLQDK